MSRSQYRRGAEFERSAKRALQEQGFFVVRAAGSHGPADLVAMRRDMWFLIQCKLGGELSGHEAEILVELADAVGCRAALCGKGKRGKIEFCLLRGVNGKIEMEEMVL